MAEMRLVLVTGEKLIAVTNTAVPLSATTLKVSNFTMQIKGTNAADIYVGDSTVTSSTGWVMNDTFPVFSGAVDDTFGDEDRGVVDLSTIFINGTATEGVRFAYVIQDQKKYNS